MTNQYYATYATYATYLYPIGIKCQTALKIVGNWEVPLQGDESEKQAAKAWVEENLWRDGWLMVDDTLVSLFAFM